MILITHSMGSIVLQAACGGGAAPWNALTHAVIASGAACVTGSRAWLESLGIPVYVTLNPDDGVLKKASNGGPFLGLQGGASFPAAEIAANATYLDVGSLDVGHRYFVKAGSSGDPGDLELLSGKVFRPTYRGEAVDTTQFAAVGQSGRIFSTG